MIAGLEDAPRFAFRGYDYAIACNAETSMAIYFRCSAGKKGGPPVTVRRGRDKTYLCLTCITVDDCVHALAVREWHRDRPNAAPGDRKYG